MENVKEIIRLGVLRHTKTEKRKSQDMQKVDKLVMYISRSLSQNEGEYIRARFAKKQAVKMQSIRVESRKCILTIYPVLK